MYQGDCLLLNRLYIYRLELGPQASKISGYLFELSRRHLIPMHARVDAPAPLAALLMGSRSFGYRYDDEHSVREAPDSCYGASRIDFL